MPKDIQLAHRIRGNTATLPTGKDELGNYTSQININTINPAKEGIFVHGCPRPTNSKRHQRETLPWMHRKNSIRRSSYLGIFTTALQ